MARSAKSHHLPTLKTRGRWTIDDARSALAAQSASGLSMAAFAAREGVSVQRLHRWRRHLEAQHQNEHLTRAAFVEVRPRRPEPIEVVLRSGRVLRVAESVDTGALARIAEALDEAERC